MTRAFACIAAGVVTALGVGMVVLYGLLVTGKVGSLDKGSDAAILAGIGAGFAIAGLMAVVALLRRRGAELLPMIRMPAIWVCVVVFAATIALGAFAVRSARYPAFDPALALVAVAATFMFMARIVTRWGPRKRVGDARCVRSGGLGHDRRGGAGAGVATRVFRRASLAPFTSGCTRTIPTSRTLPGVTASATRSTMRAALSRRPGRSGSPRWCSMPSSRR